MASSTSWTSRSTCSQMLGIISTSQGPLGSLTALYSIVVSPGPGQHFLHLSVGICTPHMTRKGRLQREPRWQQACLANSAEGCYKYPAASSIGISIQVVSFPQSSELS